MTKVTFANKNVSEEHNPGNNRTIAFAAGRFLSEGDPYGKKIGQYSMFSDTLFLDSSIEEDDRFWSVRFNRDTMIWTGIGTDWHEKIYNSLPQYLILSANPAESELSRRITLLPDEDGV